jgi:hypothetical protein
MGFNTNITICNDNLADYERHPERFARIICGGALKRDGDDQWGITVLPADHADAVQLVAAGGNFATKVYTGYYTGSHHTEDGQLALLRQWAEAMGYELHKKRAKAV